MTRRRRHALTSTLDRARRLPGYADDFAGVELDPDDPRGALARLPVLERERLQGRVDDFCDPRVRSLRLTSSGSTGTPLVLRLDRAARRRRRLQFAGFFLREGWRPWHRALSFKVMPDDSARLGSGLLDGSLLRRRTSVSVLDSPDRRFEVLRRVDPDVLQGLPSVLEQLAARVELDGWRPTRLRRVFSCSEALTPAVRALLERALGAPVVDSYAAAEALIGWECERRAGIHVLEGNVVLEVVDERGDAVAPGSIGRVLITTLDNRAMPLVRYAIGDMAIAPSRAVCPCGRRGPVIPRVLGRQVPLFEVGGAEVSPWGVIARMHELESVRQFQLVQKRPDRIEVRIRPDGRGPVDRDALRRLVAEELGSSVEVEVSQVAAINGHSTGKHAPALIGSAGGER